nr:unnamed protein product [Callosobruchus chinensis]
MVKLPRVVIIGAGPAGIAAAAKLLENGFNNITILEAENRIGGRIHSVEFGAGFVDLGAQWIHGEKGNIVYEMVKHLDLVSNSHNDYSKDFTFYLSTGKMADKHVTDKLYNILVAIIYQDKDFSYHSSFEDYVKEEYTKRIREEFPHDQSILELSKAMEEWFCKYYITYDAAESLSDFSLSNIAGNYVEYEGDPTINWRDKGYKTLLDVLMVTCSDYTSYVADHVIVTVSLGVLKNSHSKLFSPPLPPYKVRAIEGLCFGHLVKIFLQFETKWWPDDFKGFSFLWTEDDKLRLREECPHFEPSKDGRSWLEDIWGFYVVDSQPRVLLGWLTGKNTKQVELLPEEVVKSSCMFLLRKFAGDIYEIPEPEQILRSAWSNNSNFQGVYSYHGKETERLKASPSDLAVPLSAPGGAEVLLFAGEATSKHRYSTVDGANFDPYKIAIVGAGMAGLGAATKFQELNVDDYILIEADERPGGRIKTVYVNDKAVDLGAQWLHGRDNPLYRLAEKQGLLAKETSEEGLGLFVRNDGTIIDEDLVKKVNWKIGIILEDCRCFMEENEYPKSLGDYLDKNFTEYLNSSEDDPETRETKRQLLDWNIRFQIVDNSCHSLKRLSAKYWGSYICLDDEAHSNLKDGYQALVEAIVDRLPKDRVFCNTTVTSIDYGGNKIVLECNDKTVICDHLILTPSLGVLKEFEAINPPLPNVVQESIAAMGFDGIAKIFLFFKERWWGNTQGFQFLFDSKFDLNEEEKWVMYLTGFDDVFNHPNALVGWVGSEGVDQVEALEEELIGKCCVKLLRQFLPGYKVSEPYLVIRTKWLSNPLIRGSYSHITPDCDKSIGVGIEGLSEPIRGLNGVPRILLAGEAVHPSHYSTTHGAFESGMEQAAWIAEYLTAEVDRH